MRGRVGLVVVAAVGLVAAGCRERVVGKDGQFVAAPRALSFGPTALGDSKTIQLTLRNDAIAPYRVYSADSTLAGVKVGNFSEFTVEGGSSQDLSVTFSPAAEGNFSGVIQLATDTVSAGDDGVAKIAVTGTGVNAFVTVTPDTLDFGSVQIGQTQVLQLAIQNTTGADAPYSVTFEGGDVHMFSSSEAGTPKVLAAGKTDTFPIAFTPDRLLAAQAFAKVQVCPICEAQYVELDGFGVNSLVDIQPPKVNFGRVPVGSVATQTITLSNLANEPLNFQGAQWKNGHGNFTVDPVAAQQIPPGGSAQVKVSFAPTAPAQIPTDFLQLNISASNTSGPVMVPVSAQVGNSCVIVLPQKVDFGLVPAGMSATRQVDLLNRCGTDVVVQNLAVNATTNGYFSLAQAAAPIPILSAGIAHVMVTYTPKPSTTSASGAMSFQVQMGNAVMSDSVPLVGSSKVFQPCSYAVQPASLDFGLVPIGAEVSLGLGIKNIGADDCFLAGMALGAGSDSAFTSNGLDSRVLAPGAKAVLPVKFKPSAVGGYSGFAEGWVNHPTNGHFTALLSGQGVQGCFQLLPSTIDFGLTKLTCGTRVKSVVAVNNCTAPVTLQSATIGSATSSEFSVQSGPALPYTLTPGAQIAFSIAYAPVDDGDDSAALKIDAGQGGFNIAGLFGKGVTQPNQTDTFIQDTLSKVDLLFVVDNSGSMMDKQANLAANFATIFSKAQSAGVDFHIGVTSTGIEASPGGWSVCPGSVDGGEHGRLFPADNSAPRIITPTTPNAASVFANNVKVGTCHWDEQGLEAAYRALSSPLVDHADDPTTPLANDGNLGFLRQDAKLAIVVVSDADDSSPQSVPFYITFFKALKGNDPSMLVFSGIIGPADIKQCPNAEGSGNRYIQVANATGGTTENICTPDWAQSLDNVSSNVFGPRRVFQLTQTPADATQVTVTVNGQPVTSGWQYDATTNDVVFDASATPAAGSVIEVTYPLGC